MGWQELVSVGKAVLLFVIAVVLQTLLVSRISVLGVTANLFLILTVIIGLSKGSLTGALFGFFAGLVYDSIFFEFLGVNALILVLVGYFVGSFLTRFQTINLWAVFIITGAASFAAQLVFGIFQFAMGPQAAFFSMVGTQMVPGALFDALVSVLVYILLIRVRVLSPPGLDSSQARSSTE